jgi:hypothetical protein
LLNAHTDGSVAPRLRFDSWLSIRPEAFATGFTRCFKASARLDQLAAALGERPANTAPPAASHFPRSRCEDRTKRLVTARTKEPC